MNWMRHRDRSCVCSVSPGFQVVALTPSRTFTVSCVYCSVLYPSYMFRQVTEGVWQNADDLSGQTKRSEDLDILNSPPLSLSDLSGSSGLANWMPAPDPDASGLEPDVQPAVSFRSRVLDELPCRRPPDKSVSAEVRLVISCCRV